LWLAYRQRYPERPLRVEILYAGMMLEEPGVDGELVVPSTEVDVTEEVAKVAREYLREGRRRKSRLDQLDGAAARIEAGHFPPKPSDRHCAVCAYSCICPADPAGVEISGVHVDS